MGFHSRSRKMNPLLRALLLVGAVGALIGSEQTRGDPGDARKLAYLKTADPQHDADAAIARGKLRFYGIDGAAPGIIPGIDQYGVDKDLADAYGYHAIASETANHVLIDLAWKYAKIYNGVLLRYLRANPPKRSNE
jgi:hypothetical protein